MAHPNRNGGGGLSLRTLGIASAASLTAAVATSRLFPPGTIYTAALTPVIVAAVSELLNRPANRVAELRQQRRTMALEAARAPRGEEAAALQGAPEFAKGQASDDEPRATGNGTGETGPMRIYGRRRPRILHPKVWIVTGVIAFAIAAALLTLPELIFGGAVGTGHRTTFFGGGSARTTTTHTTTTDTQTQTTTEKTVTKTVPAQTAPQSTDTQTATQTQPTTTQTGTTTAPTGGTPTPGDQGTSTTQPSGTTAPAGP